ncbi:hypothetical protein F5Y04DRAFT_292044 [Hypomontagnella monticulosa]|nr:hypothetical protein F5Y04DRAFT_292044 [Hypomontagnella monticulosa]
MKTTLLVPIASCIGQLKWRHYALQPRPLDQLQVIDDASRGPWGSIVVLLKFAGHVKAGHFKAFIIQGAAIISILALAIDPSVQQIIKLQVIELKTPSPKVQIGRADAYYSRLNDASQSSRFSDFSPGWYAEAAKRFPGVEIYDYTARTRAAIEPLAIFHNVIAGSIPQLHYTCPPPASHCEWDDIHTLGICGRFRNVTSSVTQNCNVQEDCAANNSSSICAPYANLYPNGFIDGTCDFRYHDATNPSTSSFPISLNYFRGNKIPQRPTDYRIEGTVFNASLVDANATIGSVWIVRLANITTAFDGNKLSGFEAFTIDFYWCNKTLRRPSTISQHIGFESISNETLKWNGQNYSEHISYFSNVNDGPIYNISSGAYTQMPQIVHNLVTKPVTYLSVRQPTYDINKPVVVYDPQNINTSPAIISEFMWKNDMEKFIHDLADAFTAYILKPGGDNINATTATGYMFVNETIIQIQWDWLVLLICETLFVCLLLPTTIVITRGQPLLKNSTIALLIHGLFGWQPGELQIPLRETPESLDRMAEDMTVQLVKCKGGLLKLKRVDESYSLRF